MPKDEKQGEKKKKEEASSSKEEEVPKRKSSVVDSSSGDSSSSSRTASRGEQSGNMSDQSAAADSDSSAGYDEKATMTGDPEESTSNEGASSSAPVPMDFSVSIRDRTNEMVRMINNHKGTDQKLILIDESNPIPVTDETHIIPIRDGDVSGSEEQVETPSQPTSSSSAVVKKNGGQQQQQQPQQQQNNQPSTSAKQQQAKKKGKQQQQKQKQMTKKQKKALLEAERQKAQPATPPPSEEVIVAVDGDLQVHQFQTWSDRPRNDGAMIVRGTNAAARSLVGEAALTVPLLRPARNGGPLPIRHDGPELLFTDLHANSQHRYVNYLNTIGQYIAVPAAIKPIHRMGFGIAASGIPDTVPKMLDYGGTKSFMKHRYTDYVAGGAKIINWRSDFLTSLVKDRSAIEEEFSSVMEAMKNSIEEMSQKAETNFRRNLIQTMLNGELREMLLCFGEIERILMRGEKEWKKVEQGVAYQHHQKRKDRIRFIAKAIQDWTTSWTCDTYDDNHDQVNACNLLQYWASTSAGEKPCHEQNHRKCTMLGFMLNRLDDRQEMFRQKFRGGYTLLHFAAMTGMPCQVDVLLRQGCSLNVLSDQFNSPVALAMRRHNTLVARQLMWHGADIGGSLTLDHIRVKNAREQANKEMSLFNDAISRLTPYKAREFISSRLRAINNSFTSWVDALVREADPTLDLAIESVKSSLHQIRIGVDPVVDSIVKIRGIPYVKKTFNLCIEHCQSENDPVVLFMIPCQYTERDTTMPANFPYIVRVPMFENAVEHANNILEKERLQAEIGLSRTENTDLLAKCLPLKLVHNVTVRFGDGVVAMNERMTPFFENPHNGVCYGFMVSPNICKSVLQMAPIMVTFHIPVPEAEKLSNCFFMAQAIQITKLGDGTVEDPRIAKIVLDDAENKLRDAVEKADPVTNQSIGSLVKEVQGKRASLVSYARRNKSPKRKTE